MAQAVAHLIGSEEVTGPSPVISFRDGNEPCKIGKEQNASLLAILLFYDFIGRSPRRAQRKRSESRGAHCHHGGAFTPSEFFESGRTVANDALMTQEFIGKPYCRCYNMFESENI